MILGAVKVHCKRWSREGVGTVGSDMTINRGVSSRRANNCVSPSSVPVAVPVNLIELI